jgi:hypothetical protein
LVSIDWEYVEEHGGLPPGVTVEAEPTFATRIAPWSETVVALGAWFEQLDDVLRYSGEWVDAMQVHYSRWTNPRPRVRAAYRRSKVKIPG